MFRKFIALEWKAFFRSPAFTGNMILKVFMILGGIYFTVMFLLLGFGSYHLIDKATDEDPLLMVNKYIIYYLVADLLVRLFLQKIPIINIRPLLTLPIKRSTIVNFALGKSTVSFFNIIHSFFFIPFSIVLLIEGYNPLNVVLWHLGIMALVYANNFLNILLNNKDSLLAGFIAFLAVAGALQYYEVFDVTE